MRFIGKKTCLYILLGVLAIWVIMWYGTFRNIQIDSIFKELKADINVITLQEGAKDYSVVDNKWTALSHDAWITLELPSKGKLKSIELEIESMNNMGDKMAQVYYTRGKEVNGNVYAESVLSEGINVIELDGSTVVRTMRLDLTSQEGASFELSRVTVHYTAEKQILFWIVTPIIIVMYCIAVIIWRKRAVLSSVLDKKPSLRHYVENVEQIWSLAYSDFKSRFSGSYLGIFWGILQPMATILLFWFVFQVGFRSNPIDDVPFILWLSAGMIPWNYFYDSWAGGTSTFIAYNYIVKKVVFNVELLPIVKSLSSAILNGIFNLILLVIYILYGEFPGYHIIDMVYFSVCTMALSLGLSYITATLNVFIKDVGQFLGIALQFLMWLTPMMWDYHMMENYSWFYKLNPLHYIINGYREALINGNWFFHHWVQMIWFWAVTIFFIVCGRKLMRKLKLHFADVL